MPRDIACGVVSFCKRQVRMMRDDISADINHADCMHVPSSRSAKVEVGNSKNLPPIDTPLPVSFDLLTIYE